jgi:predicted  nucleic acid-binding Zn-ribbon protein
MKYNARFFQKLDPRGTQEQNLGAHSRDFPDTKVAIEETKEEADALGTDVFELETDIGSIRQRWERNGGQWNRSSGADRS